MQHQFTWTDLLSRRMHGLQPCPTNVASERARRASAPDIIDLSIGDLAFRAPAHVDAAAIQAIRSGDTHYTSVPGSAALRSSIAAALLR